ncbi:hypothetical protein M405DRAFT_837379 [Rhizopogon salebrosus TDB-379]|nr:hypothetical protein M405DRAFT_837379 [Rhizopogon salebrosus TDB-379]
MAPHMHQVAPSKSGGEDIKTESTEKTITRFTRAGSGSDADSVRILLDSKIHAEDVAHFAQFGFDERVRQLATRSGFQAGMIRGVYKHVSNFKRTERVVKAMRTAAINCAKSEIEGQEIDDFYASDEESEDAKDKNK